jgi:hypothetical protein
MDQINYNENWNNKLFCFAWSTIRLYQPEKHILGKVFRHTLHNDKGDEIITKSGRLVSMHPFLLGQLNDTKAYLDSGYNAEKLTSVIKKMYQSKNIDWDSQRLVFLVFTSK